MTAPAEVDTASVIAEHRRVERVVSGMSVGDTAVINGSEVVAVSLADALALSQAEAMSAADRRAHDLASYVRPKAAEHEKTKEPLPTRPRGPHPQHATTAL
jgi:hypothetical protein